MRSYNPEVFRRATEEWRDKVPLELIDNWLGDDKNVMYDVDGNVGLATYDYPGCYTAHWFFKVRGKEALDLAFRMYDDLFNNQGAVVVRGITPIGLKGARYLAKRIGFVSMGFIETDNGVEEIMCLSKEDFTRKQVERYGC
jgi:hypothetical protein